MKVLICILCICFSSLYADVFGREAIRLEQSLNRLKYANTDYSKPRLMLAKTALNQKKNKDPQILQEELAKIQLNIRRWRQAPLLNSSRFLLVDIAGFELYYYDSGKRTFQTHALVGQKSSPTPVFQTEIDKITINPTWIIPESIVLKEILPLLQKDINLIAEQDIDVFRITALGLKKIQLDSVAWNDVNTKSFSYLFKQRPGKENPLGKIKFSTRHPNSIYLHDTADPELFHSDNRAISHGCVRLQNALELAFELLKADGSNWTREKLIKAVESKKELEISLNKKVPIYVGYWTAWADENYNYHLREDIYGWD